MCICSPCFIHHPSPTPSFLHAHGTLLPPPSGCAHKQALTCLLRQAGCKEGERKDFISPCLSCSCNPAKSLPLKPWPGSEQLARGHNYFHSEHTQKAKQEAKEGVLRCEHQRVSQRQPVFISPCALPCHGRPIMQRQEFSLWVSQGHPGASGEPRRQMRT